jgi:hypothetical protein
MKWVTRDHVHMDRVASPWLIKRFIDPSGELGFLPFGNERPFPDDAVVYAIPGAEIGPHDKDGSTFRKLLRRYEVSDPALDMMAEIIESGVHHVFHHHEPDYSVTKLKYAEGVGLDAIAHGMMYAYPDDTENVERSMAMYDGLYFYCRATLVLKARPDIAALPPPDIWDRVRAEIGRAPWTG